MCVVFWTPMGWNRCDDDCDYYLDIIYTAYIGFELVSWNKGVVERSLSTLVWLCCTSRLLQRRGRVIPNLSMYHHLVNTNRDIKRRSNKDKDLSLKILYTCGFGSAKINHWSNVEANTFNLKYLWMQQSTWYESFFNCVKQMGIYTTMASLN